MQQLKNLLNTIPGDVKDKIHLKLNEFQKTKLTCENIFLEICFCILVANCPLERTLKTWKQIGKNFLSINQTELNKILTKTGHRFHNNKSKFIIHAQSKMDDLYSHINLKDKPKLRDWLVKNFKGIGYKEASHFLRNLGYKNFAILDRHVLKILLKTNVIKTIPKSLTRKKYLSIEKKLKTISKITKLHMDELDMYLFYLNSNKIALK